MLKFISSPSRLFLRRNPILKFAGKNYFNRSSSPPAAPSLSSSVHFALIPSRNKSGGATEYTTDLGKGKEQNKMDSKEELRKRLTPMQYQVTQEAATERPFTGCYNKFYEQGLYRCIVCHQDLFNSDTKYDSGCGWPAFNDVLDKGKITLHRDASIAGGNILLLITHPERIRTEVKCSKCGAHMGHVFEDGPKPTGKRYCINSAAIEFVSAEELNKLSTDQNS